MISGKDIIAMGFAQGPHIPAMIERARKMKGASDAEIRAALQELAPANKIPPRMDGTFQMLVEATNPDEEANLAAVRATMVEMVKTPVIRAAAVMPDACPAGSLGTIPVGAIAASEHIHPGMHSADICCSVALSVFPGQAPGAVLDKIHRATHFGPGGRSDMRMPDDIAAAMQANRFLKQRIDIGHSHFGTQGDGNHFAFVGTMKSTGETALVTHHGSRGLGAQLYKAGMTVAERYRRKISPETRRANAWIPADTRDGDDYWAALQIIRAWTKANHFALHGVCGAASDRFWNEHNFVFRKPDGLFYHGKGATPAFDGWAADATDLTLVPLNMAEPVLIVRGRNNPDALGFSPHGAGRNFSRSEHRRRGLGDFKAETAHIDARFFSNIVDPTELPSGYKNAAEVRRQIEKFDLADVVDEVMPHGCIMAGDWEQDAPWRKKRAAKAKKR